ncbi:MAG: galactonate dehydratase [Chloroflexi bacterium]|nr:galactonate dehydratase [Chloroflexota bacterium]
MKIIDVRPLVFGSDLGNFVIVRIETDQGLVGYGEGSLHSGTEAVVGAIQGLKHALIGQDPRRIEQLWLDMYRLFQMMRGGVVYTSAMSGADQALWDIKGKALGVSVHELLGGALRDRVPAFRYGLPLGATLEETREKAAAAAAEGWRAFHGDPFGAANYALAGDLPEVSQMLARLAAIREGAGQGVDIAIDCHGRFTPAGALRIARLLEPLQPIWFEEPVPPENMDALARVAAACPVPVAAGERLFTRWDFRELFERGAAAVIQPDICNAGGISEVRKIAVMAEIYHISLAPHLIYSPLALAATLQVDACIPNLIMQGIAPAMLRLQEEMFKEPVLEVRDGWFTVPQGPGLGVEIDEEKIARHPARPIPSTYRAPVWEQWYRRSVPPR